MVWGLRTHSGTAPMGAAEVRKGKQSVKMAGDDGAGAGRAQAVPS